MPTADQIADHRRDLAKHEPSPHHQKRAVAALAGYCHGLIIGGAFGPEIERQLHARIRNVCIEFDMDAPPDTRILAAFDGVVPR